MQADFNWELGANFPPPGHCKGGANLRLLKNEHVQGNEAGLHTSQHPKGAG